MDLYRALFITVALIVYGSLYPWQFRSISITVNPLSTLFQSWHWPANRFLIRDLLLNIALYVPVGAFAHLAFRSSGLRAWSLFGSLVLGFVLSTSIEMAQMFGVSRHSSAVDVVANTMGTAVGVFAAMQFHAFFSRSVRRTQQWRAMDRAAVAVLLCWFAYLLFPFFPILGRWIPGQKLLAFLNSSFIELIPFLSAAVAWFAGGRLFAAAGARSPRALLLLTILAIPAQFFLVGRHPVPSDLAGALSGVGIFALIGTRAGGTLLTAVATLTLLIIRGLAPFNFVAGSNVFLWIPFQGLLAAPWHQVALRLVEKAFYYSLTIWSLCQTGVTLRSATLLVAGILGVIEALQIGIAGRTPEITDSILAILIGAIAGVAATDRADS